MKEVGLKLLSVFVLLVLMLGPLNDPGKKENVVEYQDKIVEVTRSDGTVDYIGLEEYVKGVVSAEMPASFEMEALKAQAVASRTFVLSRDLKVDDSTASQVYLDVGQRQERWQEAFEENEKKIEEAVVKTADEVLMYDGNYISALFFSSSNGKTENNEDYFASSDIPYLKSVDSKWDLAYQDTFRQKEFSLEELNDIFGTEDFSIEIMTYTQSGRVHEVDICGDIYTGREIREKLGLASNDFDVSLDEDTYIFETVGFGHGVGMSQYGANGMASEGYKYDEILKHYYQEVSIEKLNKNE